MIPDQALRLAFSAAEMAEKISALHAASEQSFALPFQRKRFKFRAGWKRQAQGNANAVNQLAGMQILAAADLPDAFLPDLQQVRGPSGEVQGQVFLFSFQLCALLGCRKVPPLMRRADKRHSHHCSHQLCERSACREYRHIGILPVPRRCARRHRSHGTV